MDRLVSEHWRHVWRSDTIEMHSRWLHLRHGMTAVDVGCGLGYLGWLYWEYFGKNGRYFGLDRSSSLLEQAEFLSRSWAVDGVASFQVGNAYSLPYPDNFADWTMCQTLLMHLEFPEQALAEMVRVTKPGGLVMCNEPDNLSALLAVVDSSENIFDDGFTELYRKTMITWARGRKKRGLGDYSIAVKIPGIMLELGLIEIDSRCNDVCNFVQPPYDTAAQQHALSEAEAALERATEPSREEAHEFRNLYLAGGGSLSSYYRFMRKARQMAETHSVLRRKNTKNGTWYRRVGANSFYSIKARKRNK